MKQFTFWAEIPIEITALPKICGVIMNIEGLNDFTRVPIASGDILPERSGVYVVLDGDKVLYVGRAINIRRRVHSRRNQHHKLNIIKNINGLDVAYIEASISDIKDIEAKLISKINPEYNLVGNNNHESAKSELISFKLHSKDKLMVQKLSIKSGLSKSKWIRDAICYYAKVQMSVEEDSDNIIPAGINEKLIDANCKLVAMLETQLRR